MRRFTLLVLILAAGVIVAGKVRAATAEDVAALVQVALDKLLGGRESYEAYLYPPGADDELGCYPKMDLSAGGHPLLGCSGRVPGPSGERRPAGRGQSQEKELRLVRGRVQKLELVLSERDLLTVLNEQKFTQQIKNLKVQFTKGLVRLSGRVTVGFLTPGSTIDRLAGTVGRWPRGQLRPDGIESGRDLHREPHHIEVDPAT